MAPPSVLNAFVEARFRLCAVGQIPTNPIGHGCGTAAQVGGLDGPATGALTGVIDWGDVSIGDPAQDFVGFYRSLGRSFAEQVLASYTLPVDDTFWRRVAFYAGLDPFQTVRFGIIDGQQALVAEGLAALRAQLATG